MRWFPEEGEGGKCPGTWRNTRSGSSAQPRMRSEKTTVVGVERAIQCDDGRTTVYAQADDDDDDVGWRRPLAPPSGLQQDAIT